MGNLIYFLILFFGLISIKFINKQILYYKIKKILLAGAKKIDEEQGHEIYERIIERYFNKNEKVIKSEKAFNYIYGKLFDGILEDVEIVFLAEKFILDNNILTKNEMEDCLKKEYIIKNSIKVTKDIHIECGTVRKEEYYENIKLKLEKEFDYSFEHKETIVNDLLKNGKKYKKRNKDLCFKTSYYNY